MASIYDTTDGTVICEGLTSGPSMAESHKAVATAQQLAHERGVSVLLSDYDGDWLVHPDGKLEAQLTERARQVAERLYGSDLDLDHPYERDEEPWLLCRGISWRGWVPVEGLNWAASTIGDTDPEDWEPEVLDPLVQAVDDDYAGERFVVAEGGRQWRRFATLVQAVEAAKLRGLDWAIWDAGDWDEDKGHALDTQPIPFEDYQIAGSLGGYLLFRHITRPRLLVACWSESERQVVAPWGNARVGGRAFARATDEGLESVAESFDTLMAAVSAICRHDSAVVGWPWATREEIERHALPQVRIVAGRLFSADRLDNSVAASEAAAKLAAATMAIL